MTVTDAGSGVTSLAELCARARPELASLGELGASLVAMLSAVERAGSGRGADALNDPSFALDVLNHGRAGQ